MPSLETGSRYQACCGKIICSGCVYASAKMDGNVDQLCPFCRALAPETDEEAAKLSEKRTEAGDAQAMDQLGRWYQNGDRGFPQNADKALELWHRAGELGCFDSHFNIGVAYINGHGVERDMKKAIQYWALAAMGGDAPARHNLGILEKKVGNVNRALKHLMIAVEGGFNKSLKEIRQLYMGMQQKMIMQMLYELTKHT